MSGYTSSMFRWDCATQGCENKTRPSWDWMLPSFPRSVEPTDIDGMVEISGHLLFIEQKRAGVDLKEGQRVAFRRLAWRPATTVLWLRGGPEVYETLLYVGGEGAEGWHEATECEIAAWLAGWAQHADAHPYRRENAVEADEKTCGHCRGVGTRPLANPVPGGFTAQLCIYCKGSGRPSDQNTAR